MPDIQWLIFIHLFAKIGFAANEAVTSLKMVEKGLKREDLAIVVLIDFPFQIIAGWLVASWSRGDKPLRPWVIAFWPRLFFTLVAALIVLWFPKPPLTMGFFAFLVTYNVLAGFASYVSGLQLFLLLTDCCPTVLFNSSASQLFIPAYRIPW
jgi:PAT family acetyl-CoA transporter-like MFS transporter 1